jgi:hypothetical protein
MRFALPDVEVIRMRVSFIGVCSAVIASTCLVAPSAFGSPHGQHARPTTHTTEPAHPAATGHHTAVPVPQKIAANPALVTRLQPLVPAGMTLADAAKGFKNEGQFIAALHVSHNLNIPFAKLKAEMTGSDHDSLGQAIHQLQPNADAKAAVKTAEKEAHADIKATKPAKTDTDKDDR